MGRIGKDAESWLPELRVALSAIALALNGRNATPELLDQLKTEYETAIPEHRVVVEWYPHGYMFLEGRGQPPWPAEYGLLISGKRLASAWLICADEFQAVLALAS